MKVRKAIFSFLSIIAISLSIVFSFISEATLAGVWLTFSVFMITFGWPELTESISFLGSSIKLREAKDTIKELKELAKIISGATLSLIQSSNRFDGMSDSKKSEIYDSIYTMLTNLNIPTNEINNAQSDWHDWVEFDYKLYILNPKKDHPEIPKEHLGDWHTFHSNFINKLKDVTASEIREGFKKYNGLTEKVDNLIGKLEYYEKNKKHKCQDTWEKRGSWFT